MTDVKGRHEIKISQNYVECTEGGSNKFYRTIVIANLSSNLATLICTYGPIGRSGTSKIANGLPIIKANNDSSKKLAEKERKGYVKAKARDVLIGAPGHLIAHTFGEDKLKDKEVEFILVNAIGEYALEEMKAKDGWLTEAETAEQAAKRAAAEAAAKAKAEAAAKAKEQAELDARTATYSSAWGEWA